MQPTWRRILRQHFEKTYVQSEQDWFDIYFSTAGHVDLTIVSNQFAGLSYVERENQIHEIFKELEISLETGMLFLYTRDEAQILQIKPLPKVSEQAAYTWVDQALVAANLEEGQKPAKRPSHHPRTIVFYSFKGGVGRTTALTHIAWILAKRGRKVLAVDLDLEAPSLSSAFQLSPNPPYGIVDYFYSHAYGSKEESRISVTEIFSEVRISDAPGRLFIVPTGKLNLDYLARIDDLSTTIATRTSGELWTTFFNEINEQVQPDIILVDSRTGLNKWGAFTLLRAADQAIIFLYPNEQNRQGIELLLDTLAAQIPLQFIFSPVYPSEAGLQLVKQHWSTLQEHQKRFVVHNEPLPEEDDIGLAEPITIYYQPEIALAANYPVTDLVSHYMSIANLIDEENTAVSLDEVLSDVQQKRKILESLKFPQVDAASTGHGLSEIFQRTNDFDKFLDNSTCLIRGRKGTGKTALYRLCLAHETEARKLAHKRLDNIILLSGHGYFQKSHPTKGEFREFYQAIEKNSGLWIDLWRAYLFLRLYQENHLQNTRDSKFQRLRTLIMALPKGTDLWKSEHTQTLIQIVTSPELSSLVRDWIASINEQLRKQQQIIWFLYDDLDVDLERELREEALIGLFQLVQTLEAQNIRAIRLKIFLREDIWGGLIFDNKSHLNGRDIILQWTYKDFLGLALKQALQSTEFSELVNRFAPVSKIDEADTQTLEAALQILWGIRRQPNDHSKYVSRWVYERLTDASQTTFPRILNVLLKQATAHELENFKDKVTSPSDRLLQIRSLNQGLIQASHARCNDLREEYPELRPFFDSLVNCEIIASQDKLRQLWEETIPQTLPEFKDFKRFVVFLINIGLIKLAEKREKEQGYRFAEIYTHGF
jgi:cellulose biosynthesis protein BcsQ